jgi:hypothetical protein
MKKLISILLVILFLGIVFIWSLYRASPHKIPIETHLTFAIIAIAIIAIFAIFNQKWNILKFWVLLFIVETLIIYRYNFIQPQCEPCLPNTFCPPCISDEQIIWKYVGFSIVLIFLVLRMVQGHRNSDVS